MFSAMDSETLYFQLRQLVASIPKLDNSKGITADDRMWLGRAATLVSKVLPAMDGIAFTVACDNLGGLTHDMNANTVISIVYRALAVAELAAPAAAQGQFLAAGDTFNALAAVTKVFNRAKADLLIVDKYADVTLLSDFAVTAPEGVRVRILCAEGENRRAALTPAVLRWVQQFGAARPIEVRLAPGPQLHDRLIMVDAAECWVAGQSFNGMAVKSHTYLSKLDPELAEQKLAAYADAWAAAANSALPNEP